MKNKSPLEYYFGNKSSMELKQPFEIEITAEDIRIQKLANEKNLARRKVSNKTLRLRYTV